jgi:hypothetical protein
MVDAPNANHAETLVAIGLKAAPTGGTMNYHENCVIRCCFVDLGYNPASPKNLIGLAAVGCAGTIIELNRIFNCKIGGPYQSGASTDRYASKRLVIRENFYRNVDAGVSIALDNSSGDPFSMESVMVFRNEVELLPGTAPVGIQFTEASTAEVDSFQNLFIRGNIIRQADVLTPVLNGKGILFEAAGYAQCENNIINVETDNDSVIRNRGISAQIFNNRRPDGELVQAYDLVTGLLISELTTEAENYLLSL